MTLGWDDRDPAVRRALDEQLLKVVVPRMVHSAKQRDPLSRDLACGWHRTMVATIVVTPPDTGGRLRDPSWFKGEVQVGGLPGVPTPDINSAIDEFESTYATRIRDLDERISLGTGPQDVERVEEALRLAAEVHGEWVRIHPFCNGNGRMSRLWCNWVLIRYGIRPLVRPTPRPVWGPVLWRGQDRYEWAAELSLSVGNHRMMFSELKSRYRKVYESGPVNP